MTGRQCGLQAPPALLSHQPSSAQKAAPVIASGVQQRLRLQRAAACQLRGCHRPTRVVSAKAAGGQGPAPGRHTPGDQRQADPRSAALQQGRTDQTPADGRISAHGLVVGGGGATPATGAASSVASSRTTRPGASGVGVGNGVGTPGAAAEQDPAPASTPPAAVPPRMAGTVKRGTLPCQAWSHRALSPKPTIG